MNLCQREVWKTIYSEVSQSFLELSSCLIDFPSAMRFLGWFSIESMIILGIFGTIYQPVLCSEKEINFARKCRSNINSFFCMFLYISYIEVTNVVKITLNGIN